MPTLDFFCYCPKAHDNANIAQESEQNDKVENMLVLDSTSVGEECGMMCTELQYEDVDEDLVDTRVRKSYIWGSYENRKQRRR